MSRRVGGARLDLRGWCTWIDRTAHVAMRIPPITEAFPPNTKPFEIPSPMLIPTSPLLHIDTVDCVTSSGDGVASRNGSGRARSIVLRRGRGPWPPGLSVLLQAACKSSYGSARTCPEPVIGNNGKTNVPTDLLILPPPTKPTLNTFSETPHTASGRVTLQARSYCVSYLFMSLPTSPGARAAWHARIEASRPGQVAASAPAAGSPNHPENRGGPYCERGPSARLLHTEIFVPEPGDSQSGPGTCSLYHCGFDLGSSEVLTRQTRWTSQ